MQVVRSALLILVFVPVIGFSQIPWTTPIIIDTTGPNPQNQFLSAMAIDDQGTIFVAWSESGSYAMVARSTNGGTSWQRNTAHSGPGLARSVRDLATDHLGNVWLLWSYLQSEFSEEYLNLSKSTDGGNTFAVQFTAREYGGVYFFPQLAIDRANSVYMLWDDTHFKVTRLAAGDSARRTDIELRHDSLSIGFFCDLVISPHDAVYCLWQGRHQNPDLSIDEYILCSTSIDSGMTFSEGVRVDSTIHFSSGGSLQDYPKGVVDKQGNLNVILTRGFDVSTWDVRVAESTDGAKSFLPGLTIYHVGTSTNSQICSDSLGGLNVLWEAHDGLRYSRSTDGGANFSLSSLLPLAGMSSLIADKHGALLVSLDNVRVYFLRSNATAGIVVPSSTPGPSFALQNYPNPFNASTKIPFSIGKSAFVTLKIYDIIGREACSLVAGYFRPGTYSVSWDATNMTSGTYFYRLTVGSFVQVKKMIVMK